MRDLFKMIREVASTDVAVLITGESGTGKEVAANTIHSLSRRARRAVSSPSTAPRSRPS